MIVIVPMVMIMGVVMRVLVFGEEVRIDFELGIQVETAQIEDFLDIGVTEIHHLDRRARIHVQQAMAQVVEGGFIHEVRLGNEQTVRKADLALHHFVLIQLVIRVLRVDQRDDRVEQEFVGDLVVHEERLRHRAGVRETCGFDHDAFEIQFAGALFRGQVAEHACQVAANCAADAAVAHLDDLFVAVLHEDLVIDVLFAELVLDHGDLHAVLFVQDALEQCGFTAAEEAGQDSDGNHGGRLFCA
jgi:hypothetical protein